MMHTCTKHKPGTPQCYRDKCRCAPCVTAFTRTIKRERHLKLAGLGRQDSAGTVRRLQALIARGWSIRHLGHRLGRTGPNMNRLMFGTDEVLLATYVAVKRLYDELWDAEPPAASSDQKRARTRALNRAEREGWPPPLAWDDGTGPHGIDNPDATPHPWKRTERKTSRTEDLIDLIEAGATWAELTRDRTPASIQRALHRAGRSDLYLRVRPAAEPRRELWKDVA